LSATVFITSVCTAEPCVKRIDARLHAVVVDVDDEIDAEAPRRFVAERDHLPELPRGVHMHEREGRLGRVERLHGQVHHDGAVLADRIEHHRVLALGDDLPHDVDALGFQALEMGEGASCQDRLIHLVEPIVSGDCFLSRNSRKKSASGMTFLPDVSVCASRSCTSSRASWRGLAALLQPIMQHKPNAFSDLPLGLGR
jgi:hypothetical protein